MEVTDQGHGIAEEDLSKIFDPFFTTKKQNTGLGLAAAWGILKSHNAFVDVTSKKNVGTKFRVFFPILETPKLRPDTIQEDGPGSGGTLLIVDDEIEIAELTARYLRTRNYSVFTAPNGEEGLRIFEDASPPIDLVITDMVMHPVDGVELFYRLKEKQPDLPIYIMSGYFRDSRLQDLLEHGANGVISKPFSLRNLEREIRKYFDSIKVKKK